MVDYLNIGQLISWFKYFGCLQLQEGLLNDPHMEVLPATNVFELIDHCLADDQKRKCHCTQALPQSSERQASIDVYTADTS